MKITAIFLGKKKNSISITNKLISFLFSNMLYLILSVTLVFVMIFLGNNTSILKNVFSLATNFRQADKIQISASSIFSMYSLYNEKNYTYDRNIEVAQNDKDNMTQKQNEYLSDYEKLDAVITDKNSVEAVLSNIPSVNVTENSSSIQRISIDNMKILNYSSYRNIDFSSLLNANIIFTKTNDRILLYNTHTSETYTNSEKYQFSYSGTMRTQDALFNMISIAKELRDNLNSKGINATNDTTPHDYGTYTSAYQRSRITVKNALKAMGGAAISIDVHRDAIADLTYAPKVNINGVNVAQCMFVVGVGTDTNKNDYYLDNLKLALKLQRLADVLYPGLFRPMIIRNSLYNQDLNKYSLLIEVGATGNTIEEAKCATRCITNLLNIIYKD